MTPCPPHRYLIVGSTGTCKRCGFQREFTTAFRPNPYHGKQHLGTTPAERRVAKKARLDMLGAERVAERLVQNPARNGAW